MIEMTQLVQFQGVAKFGNMTHAAKELGISQPALSRAIAKLEEEFGVPLFERKTRTLELTDAGKLLQERSREMLNILDDLKEQLRDDGKTGHLTIGAIPTVAPYFLPGFLREFSQVYLQSKLSISERTTEQLIQACQQGDVDLGILALPISVKYLEVQTLMSDELLLVHANGHELADQDPLKLKQLADYPFVLMDEAHCLSGQIVSMCHRKSFHPVSVERTTQLVTVQELVSLGHGISMIPSMACVIDHASDRKYRRLSQPRPVREIAIVTNPYRVESKLLSAIKKRLKSYAKEFEAMLQSELGSRLS